MKTLNQPQARWLALSIMFSVSIIALGISGCEQTPRSESSRIQLENETFCLPAKSGLAKVCQPIGEERVVGLQLDEEGNPKLTPFRLTTVPNLSRIKAGGTAPIYDLATTELELDHKQLTLIDRSEIEQPKRTQLDLSKVHSVLFQTDDDPKTGKAQMGVVTVQMDQCDFPANLTDTLNTETSLILVPKENCHYLVGAGIGTVILESNIMDPPPSLAFEPYFDLLQLELLSKRTNLVAPHLVPVSADYQSNDDTTNNSDPGDCIQTLSYDATDGECIWQPICVFDKQGLEVLYCLGYLYFFDIFENKFQCVYKLKNCNLKFEQQPQDPNLIELSTCQGCTDNLGCLTASCP